MLEALTAQSLRSQVGLFANEVGAPAIAPLAQKVRQLVSAWRSPPRQRVTAYLHRQLAAAGYDADQARESVTDVVDALIDIGDLTKVRLGGKASLVLSRGSFIRITDAEHAVLGAVELDPSGASELWRYAREADNPSGAASVISFSDWIGPVGFHLHLARRTGGSGDGSIGEFWATLCSVLRHEGSPIDSLQIRAVIGPPSAQNSFFGRHNLPSANGRWSTKIPEGYSCAVRPGRSPNEWHPILVCAAGDDVSALDLYNWDEWNWALLARGIAMQAPERSSWHNGVLTFEHPIPDQFNRAFRLLGGPGERPWTWRISEPAFRRFEDWRRSEI